jgi:hypothetical protein
MRKHHTMSCPYPEGCSCGAAEYNNLLDQLSRQEQELATLRAKAKAKAYDEGTQQIAVYSEVIWSDNYLNMLEKADLTFGSPKVRVRVCKEVVV